MDKYKKVKDSTVSNFTGLKAQKSGQYCTQRRAVDTSYN